MANVTDLLNMDPDELMKMNRKELAKVITNLGNTANRRIKRLEKEDLESPALRSIQKSGGRITARGKNLNQLRAEFFRAKQFYEAKTSTVKGWKSTQKETRERLKSQTGVDMSAENEKLFWDVFSRWKERDPGMYRNKNYSMSGIYSTIVELQNQGITNNEELALKLQEKQRELYEETATEPDAISRFFELEDF